MAFPTSPTEGQTHNDGQQVWEWKNGFWRVRGLAPTAPYDPNLGVDLDELTAALDGQFVSISDVPVRLEDFDPLGTIGTAGVDASDAMDLAIAEAVARGGVAISVGAGAFDLSRKHTLEGIEIRGAGLLTTTFRMTTAVAQLEFLGRGDHTEGFTIDGLDTATNPLLIGLGTQRSFSSIKVTESAGDGVRVHGMQNSVFIDIDVVRSRGYNLVLDKGAGGLTFMRCQFGGQGKGGTLKPNLGNVKFTQSQELGTGPYSAGTTNVDFFSCQFERTNSAETEANILIEAGNKLRWWGGNIVNLPTTVAKPLVWLRPAPDGSGGSAPGLVTFTGVHMQGSADEMGDFVGWAFQLDYAISNLNIISCNIAVVDAVVRSTVGGTQRIGWIGSTYNTNHAPSFGVQSAGTSRAINFDDQLVPAVKTANADLNTNLEKLVFAATSGIVLKLPNPSWTGAGLGKQFTVKNTSAGDVTIGRTNAAHTIDGTAADVTLPTLQSRTFVSDNVGWWTI